MLQILFGVALIVASMALTEHFTDQITARTKTHPDAPLLPWMWWRALLTGVLFLFGVWLVMGS